MRFRFLFMHETGVLDPTSKNKECMNVYMRLFYQINLSIVHTDLRNLNLFYNIQSTVKN